MTPERAPRIAVGPERDPRFERAVTGGGGVPCGLEETPDALVWTAGPQDFPEVLPASVRWVQLPSAGVEYWLSQGVVKAHPRVTWTSAAAAYSTTVAEHALLLLLAALAALVVSGWAMIGPFSVEFLAAVDLGWVLVGAALLIGAVLVFLPNRRR